MRTYRAPSCAYCRQPLGDDDMDPESGDYRSAHFRCESPRPGARYLVRSHIVGTDGPVTTEHATYDVFFRAQAEMAYLASTNRPKWMFDVFDMEDHTLVDERRGQLPRQ
jgi:hypothetical protein